LELLKNSKPSIINHKTEYYCTSKIVSYLRTNDGVMKMRYRRYKGEKGELTGKGGAD
jgi:hypothetical protein